MKTINFILVSVIISLILSCTKNDTTNDLKDENIKFYSSLPNKNYAPIAKKYDLSTNTETWIFGSFNNTGLHDTIRRIVVDKKALNYYSTIMIDKLKRPVMIYTTNKNGTNENILLKIDYPVNQNKIVYSKYNFNWATKKDILLRQQVVDTIIGSSVFTYRTQVETNSNYWNKTYIQLNEIKNNISKFIDNNIDSELLPKSDFSLRSPNIVNSGVIAIQVQQMLEEAKLYASVSALNQPVSINEYITSDDQSFSNFINSSSNMEIPNPKGTPTNPNGAGCDNILQKLANCLSKNWVVTYSVYNGNNQAENGNIWTFNSDLTSSLNGSISTFSYTNNYIYFGNINQPWSYSLTDNDLILIKAWGTSTFERRFTKQ